MPPFQIGPTVDHVLGQQPITSGDLGVTGLAAAERTTFGQQFRPGRIVDRAVNPAAAKQRRIGGVDDGIDPQRRDIGDDDFKPHIADLARHQIKSGDG